MVLAAKKIEPVLLDTPIVKVRTSAKVIALKVRKESVHLQDVQIPPSEKKGSKGMVKATALLELVRSLTPLLFKSSSRLERAYRALALLTGVFMMGAFDWAAAYGMRGVTLALFLLFAWSLIAVLVCVGCYFGWKHLGIIRENKKSD